MHTPDWFILFILTIERSFYIMGSMNNATFPLYLTKQELATFNRFWQNLSQSDREALEEVLHSTSQEGSAIDRSVPYQVFLLHLLLREHREVKRLWKLLEQRKQNIRH